MRKTRTFGGWGLIFLTGTIGFAASGADFGTMLTTLATQGQQLQAQNKEIEKQQKTQDAVINQTNVAVNQQASNLNMLSPYGTAAAPPNANSGYPLTDPYTNPQYWNQRGHQFTFSMGIAGKRSEALNNKAKLELEAQKKKDQMMVQALGTAFTTIGSTIEQQAKDKAAEAKKKADEAAAIAKKKKEIETELEVRRGFTGDENDANNKLRMAKLESDLAELQSNTTTPDPNKTENPKITFGTPKGGGANKKLPPVDPKVSPAPSTEAGGNSETSQASPEDQKEAGGNSETSQASPEDQKEAGTTQLGNWI